MVSAIVTIAVIILTCVQVFIFPSSLDLFGYFTLQKWSETRWLTAGLCARSGGSLNWNSVPRLTFLVATESKQDGSTRVLHFCEMGGRGVHLWLCQWDPALMYHVSNRKATSSTSLRSLLLGHGRGSSTVKLVPLNLSMSTCCLKRAPQSGGDTGKGPTEPSPNPEPWKRCWTASVLMWDNAALQQNMLAATVYNVDVRRSIYVALCFRSWVLCCSCMVSRTWRTLQDWRNLTSMSWTSLIQSSVPRSWTPPNCWAIVGLHANNKIWSIDIWGNDIIIVTLLLNIKWIIHYSTQI